MTQISCSEEEETTIVDGGTVSMEFDNYVGARQLSLEDDGSTDYKYETTSGQTYNLTTFQYYISNIILTGPNGEVFEDEMNVSADADEIKGYYLIQQDDSQSKLFDLSSVPYGEYNSITLNVGIAEDAVQEGAAGGILDPAEGAPFWNWNSGYISLMMEGYSPNIDSDDLNFQIHVGGWKDIEVSEGETQKFYNNIKTITLDFGVDVTVSESYAPTVHMVVDVEKILADIDFEITNQVHTPSGGVVFAERFEDAFVVDHVHQ